MYTELHPDAVLISTPHTLHFAQGMQALEAGCHIYMEKPMVTSLEHAYRLADQVRESGKILVIGYNTPCSPEFYYVRQLIREKTFGNLEMVSGYLSQGSAAGKRQMAAESALSGGGQAYDSGAHLS